MNASFNVADYLLENGEDDHVALLTLQETYTFRQVRQAISTVAAYLLSEGALKGDRVLLVAENSLFWVAAYFGALKAGLTVVPLPSTVRSEELKSIVERTESRYACVQSNLLPKYRKCFSRERILVDVPQETDGPTVALSRLFERNLQLNGALWLTTSSDLAALMFTSGSTGEPRGVMVSHGNIRANTDSIVKYLELESSDRMMVVLPFHYCFGTSLLHTHFRVGASLVLDPRFMYPEKVLQNMQDKNCTGFAGVPSHFQVLLNRTSFRKKQFPSLRHVQQAGGQLAPTFILQLSEALPDKEIFVMYGQTEATARLSFLPPRMLTAKLGSIGKGIPGVRLTVERDGRPVQVGEVGEIVAEGENVAKGYWLNPDESDLVFRNGRLYTGDIGTVDLDGYIFIVGRSRDFVKCGGKRVSCKQIEQQLLECGELLEVAVIGIPDEILGEAVKAFVVPRKQSQNIEHRVRRYCLQNLPFQLVPKEIEVMDNLPKNHSGKILKEQLRKQWDVNRAVGL